MKAIEYCLCSSFYKNELEDKVNGLIEDGWQPHGDLKYFDGDFIQAMLRLEYFPEEEVANRLNDVLIENIDLQKENNK
jgi:hypothetical protein